MSNLIEKALTRECICCRHKQKCQEDGYRQDCVYGKALAALRSGEWVVVDRQEAIIAISSKLMEAFRAGQHVDRFSDQASEYYGPAFDMQWAPKILDDLQRREGEEP